MQCKNICAEFAGACDTNAKCLALDSTQNDTRSGFGYGCQCDDGYEGTGTYCTDINECRESNYMIFSVPCFFSSN